MEDAEILKILYMQNPWWEGKAAQAPEKKRGEFHLLKKTLEEKQITAILGPRRVGKSVLMQQLINDLLETGVPPKRILFAQLDEPRLEGEKGLLITRILEAYYSSILGKSPIDQVDKVFVFLDEVQNVGKWAESLKGYYDRNYNIKFTVSGSSSAGITRGSSESLAGRVNLQLILTLKFADYLMFKGITAPHFQQQIKSALDDDNPELLWASLKKSSIDLAPSQQKIETLLGEYMVKGGYIELLDKDNYSRNLQYLKDLLQLVIYKDLVKVFGIRNPKNMEDLLLFLANHSGELFSEASTASKLGMKNQTISEYIGYLENIYLVSASRIYAANRSKQIRNPRKIYISDSGLRNALNGTYSPKALTDGKDAGLMAETVVHSHLLHLAFYLDSYNAKCYYSKNGNEVDNILQYSKKAVPIEVKYQNSINSEDALGCAKFMKENKSPFGIIITKNRLDFRGNIFYIPLWHFLLIC